MCPIELSIETSLVTPEDFEGMLTWITRGVADTIRLLEGTFDDDDE